MLDHLKARDHAARHWVFVFSVWPSLVPHKDWASDTKTTKKPPKSLKKSNRQKKSPKQTKTTYQNPKNTPWNVCLYELSSCSTQSNNGLCLFVMNDALFLSLNQWHWCFSAFDRAVIDIFSWWWWWFVEFLILEANTITFTTCSSSSFFFPEVTMGKWNKSIYSWISLSNGGLEPINFTL